MTIKHQKIIGDGFWEYKMDKEMFISLSQSENFKEQQFLFEKILLNSTHFLQSLKQLVKFYVVPTFSRDYIVKCKNMVEFYFFDMPLSVNELKWI